MSYELRDHRGHLFEERDDRGRLMYTRRSNSGRERELHFGRAGRATFHKHPGTGASYIAVPPLEPPVPQANRQWLKAG